MSFFFTTVFIIMNYFFSRDIIRLSRRSTLFQTLLETGSYAGLNAVVMYLAATLIRREFIGIGVGVQGIILFCIFVYSCYINIYIRKKAFIMTKDMRFPSNDEAAEWISDNISLGHHKYTIPASYILSVLCGMFHLLLMLLLDMKVIVIVQ